MKTIVNAIYVFFRRKNQIEKKGNKESGTMLPNFLSSIWADLITS